MNKAFSMAAAVLCLGTTALLANSGRTTLRLNDASAQLAIDGAFRDGLYLGKLDADGGRPMRASIARWSAERDRNSFVAGYQRGYNGVLAQAVITAQGGPKN